MLDITRTFLVGGRYEMLPARQAKRIRQQNWNVAGKIRFPIDPFVIARSLGIEVVEKPLQAEIAGFILKESGGTPEICVNSNDPEYRRRFTVAHELGHYVANPDEEDLGFVDFRDEISSSGYSPAEVWANQFAAELLMPAAILKKWWADGKSYDDMRRRLGVSKAALSIRLDNLGLIR